MAVVEHMTKNGGLLSRPTTATSSRRRRRRGGRVLRHRWSLSLPAAYRRPRRRVPSRCPASRCNVRQRADTQRRGESRARESPWGSISRQSRAWKGRPIRSRVFVVPRRGCQHLRRVRVIRDQRWYNAAQRGSHDYAWRMGSIASVLQWHCSECALINPTESARCARCGLTRIRSDERANRGRPDHCAIITAERSGSARQVGGKAGGIGRPSARRREDGERPREKSSSGESTPPTPPPRTDRLARNPTDTLLPVSQCESRRRAVVHGWGSWFRLPCFSPRSPSLWLFRVFTLCVCCYVCFVKRVTCHSVCTYMLMTKCDYIWDSFICHVLSYCLEQTCRRERKREICTDNHI